MKSAAAALAILVLGVAGWLILHAEPEISGTRPEAGSSSPADAAPEPVPALPPPPDAAEEAPPVGAASPSREVAGESAEAPDADAKPGASEPVSADRLLKETTVSFEWNQTTGLAALAGLSAEIGVPIVVPGDLRDRLGRGSMSMVVKEISAESALDLLLALAGADCTWETRDGKIHIVRK